MNFPALETWRNTVQEAITYSKIFSFMKSFLSFQVTPGGKADLSKAIAVGDEIVAINGIECQSRSEAIELVRCSRHKLKIALKR